MGKCFYAIGGRCGRQHKLIKRRSNTSIDQRLID
jgi:hypothetical protein